MAAVAQCCGGFVFVVLMFSILSTVMLSIQLQMIQLYATLLQLLIFKIDVMCMLESIKTIFEILAYASAAIFFIFKAYSGAFYVSLSLHLKSDKRKKLNDQEDILVIDLTLIGGENASLDIYQVQGRITYNNTVEEIFNLEGVKRLTINNINNDLEIHVPWTIYTENKYRVSLKESTSFAKTLIVPNNAVCEIEVIVVGSRKKFFGRKPTISQWRASQISLPN